MIKQTLYFSNPTYLSLKDKQLVIRVKNSENEKTVTRPIEDLGMIILDTGQITITNQAIQALQTNKTVIVSCDSSHMPSSIMLPMQGHTEQSERYRIQMDASLPLKKNLWQQTIEAKVRNQRAVLEKLKKPTKRLDVLLKRIQSGDPENIEGQAAAYYWPTLFKGFIRDKDGLAPNSMLNYGYAILRAMVARALTSSGLLLTLGIHHKNKYNAYCLADDIMEPYRPFVDQIVYQLSNDYGLVSFLDRPTKQQLLSVGQIDAYFKSRKSPLMVGMAQTTSSLYKCFAGKKRKIIYPELR